VVAVSGGAEGETLLRRGARIASRLAGGELLAVYSVRNDGLAAAPLSEVAELRRLTDELGGEFHTVSGEDAAEAVLAFARGVNATQILIGVSRRAPWQRALSAGMAERIIAGSGDIDVHVVTHQAAGRSLRRRGRGALPPRRVGAGMIAAVLLPTALTMILLADPLTKDLPLVIPVFLLATVIVAVLGGIVPAIVAAVLGSLLLNWFFVPPVGTLTVADPHNALALVVFVLVGVLVAIIVHRNARRTDEARAAEREASALAELSNSLLGATDQLPLLLRRAVDMFGVEAAGVTQKAPIGVATVVASAGPFDPLAVSDHERAYGDYELVLQPAGLAANRRRLFTAFATHAGAILQRQELQASARGAERLARDNEARTALLSAVSHDLRTPLAGIKAAIGSLRSKEISWSAEDEDELEAAIEESTDRLEALVGNLLDLSRLQVGALVATIVPTDLEELIPSTLATVSDPDRVAWVIEPDARRALADAGLLDRVLGNLVENALRYQPTPDPVLVSASRVADRVEIRVLDHGVGVPVDDQERIFEPFQRQSDVPGGDGLGLGLAVARGLAEAMNGTLSAEPTPGGGLTMVVALAASGEPHTTDPGTP
jgi:two-component system, OmpR family, sensor histidine kinase KdpD